MARLNVQAAVRWAGDTPDETGPDAFRNTPMLLAIAVTDGDGARVDLNAGEIRVGYQHTAEASEDSIAVVSGFHSNGPTFGDAHWHSCIVSPQPTDSFGRDEVFLYVTVRRNQDRGQALVLARYRHKVADLGADVRGLQDANARLRDQVAGIDNGVREVAAAIKSLTSTVARLPSGITAVNALGQILAMLEQIKEEV